MGLWSLACSRLELFAANLPAASRRLVVFCHGGRWRHGDKGDYKFVGASSTRRRHLENALRVTGVEAQIEPRFTIGAIDAVP